MSREVVDGREKLHVIVRLASITGIIHVYVSVSHDSK